ncbi:hypothetical protein [Streptomyces sp. MBT27]|nr:hypothetical protein [Streptomyces sp. MBT27]
MTSQEFDEAHAQGAMEMLEHAAALLESKGYHDLSADLIYDFLVRT